MIVKEIGEDQYEVIGNSFIYAVAEEADLERVWCIIADSSKETLELTKILSGEETPKINLSTATRDEIQAGLKYLKDKNLVKDFDLLVATNRIDEAPARPYWKTLEPITSLKCKITKAKIKSLEEVFYLDPQPEPQVEPEPKVEPESKSLKDLTVKKLKEIAKQRKIAGYNNMKKPELIKALSQNSP
ncbi:MAG: Rho termination factor N-terminal domain-containing protein [Actinomycetota bacterium]